MILQILFKTVIMAKVVESHMYYITLDLAGLRL
jgi:hypothetical protein